MRGRCMVLLPAKLLYLPKWGVINQDEYEGKTNEQIFDKLTEIDEYCIIFRMLVGVAH